MHVFNFSVSFPYCEYWKSLHYLVFHPRFDSWDAKIHWRSDRLPTPVFLGFPGGSAGQESNCNVGDLGSIPELRRSPGEGKGYPLQYSGLENSMDCTIHGVTKSRTRLNNFHMYSASWKALYVYIHPFFFRYLSHLITTEHRVPCAIQ